MKRRERWASTRRSRTPNGGYGRSVLRALTATFAAAAALLATGCANPCDDLVDKRCECGPEVCRAARDELKLATELLRNLGGAGGRQVLAQRCKARLQSFTCP